MAMFGPGSPFKERIQFDNDVEGIPSFSLGDDDPEAIGVIFKILHHLNDQVDRKMSFDKVVEMAVVADKYSLRESLQMWMEIWVTAYHEISEKDTLDKMWICMEYKLKLFDNPHDPESYQFPDRAAEVMRMVLVTEEGDLGFKCMRKQHNEEKGQSIYDIRMPHKGTPPRLIGKRAFKLRRWKDWLIRMFRQTYRVSKLNHHPNPRDF